MAFAAARAASAIAQVAQEFVTENGQTNAPIAGTHGSAAGLRIRELHA